MHAGEAALRRARSHVPQSSADPGREIRTRGYATRGGAEKAAASISAKERRAESTLASARAREGKEGWGV